MRSELRGFGVGACMQLDAIAGNSSAQLEEG